MFQPLCLQLFFSIQTLPQAPVVLEPSFNIPFFVTFGLLTPFSFLGDVRDCLSGNTDFPGALTGAVGGRFLEAAVPITTSEVTHTGSDWF